jgi:chemotaxis protein MotB
MNKDFFFNILAGFLFIVLVCGSIVLADYVFFEGELLKKTEIVNSNLNVELREMRNENKQLQMQLKGTALELEATMQNLAVLQRNRTAAMETTPLQVGTRETAAQGELYAPDRTFLSHLHDAIGDAYPGIELMEGKFIFKDNIFFASASAMLSAKAKTALNQVAITIKTLEQKISPDANWVIKVMGHTDSRKLKSRKPFSSNWILASARAVTIVQYLISRGVDPSRLYAAGFSAHQAHQSKNAEGTVKAVRHAVLSFDRRVGDA